MAGERANAAGCHSLNPETRNQKLRNFEPGTRNLEPGIRNPKPETRSTDPETWNPECGSRNPEPSPQVASLEGEGLGEVLAEIGAIQSIIRDVSKKDETACYTTRGKFIISRDKNRDVAGELANAAVASPETWNPEPL